MKVLLKNKNLEAFDDAVISRPGAYLKILNMKKAIRLKLLVLPGEKFYRST